METQFPRILYRLSVATGNPFGFPLILIYGVFSLRIFSYLVIICLAAKNCYGHQESLHARFPKFPLKFWMLPSFRMTSTSTWWTGPLWMCSVWDWGPVFTCGAPAPARCVPLLFILVFLFFFFLSLTLRTISAPVFLGDTSLWPFCRRRFSYIGGLVREGMFFCTYVLKKGQTPLNIKSWGFHK